MARQNTQLADRAEAQALDRYANGVTNYLEVVQARETVAQADESLVASLYAFHVAKLDAGARDRRFIDSPRRSFSVMTNEHRTALTRRTLAAAAVILVAGIASIGWVRSGHSETTDDAQIEGHLHAISARMTGTVVRINPDVQNNHFVKAGTLLVELDPTDYDVALEQARATLTTREAAGRASAAEVPITQSDARSASWTWRARTRPRPKSGWRPRKRTCRSPSIASSTTRRSPIARSATASAISRSSRSGRSRAPSTTRARATRRRRSRRSRPIAPRCAPRSGRSRGAKSRVAQKRAEIAGARSAADRVTDATARSASAAGQVRQAAADVHAAELNLRYTKIYAPVSGIVGRKTVEVGHRVQPGQTLLVVVPVDDIWVTANFKETQVKRMRPGQAVQRLRRRVRPRLCGHGRRHAGAAGTLFSLLPPENASGNFVKVVQRLPVRIRLNPDQDPEHQLRPGMSVEARVRLE